METEKTAKDIARYLVYRCLDENVSITPLKLQKLIYFVYVWSLLLKKKKPFQEKFEAWPMGPVLPSLYKELKRYGCAEIDKKFLEIKKTEDLEKLKESLAEILDVLEKVYDKYATRDAFDLVTMTHNEKAWLSAREGLDAGEPSNKALEDKYIKEQYA